MATRRRESRNRNSIRLTEQGQDANFQKDYLIPGAVFTCPGKEPRQSLDGYGLEAIPPRRRLHWIRPTLIYAGCMVSLPVIYVGAMLLQRYSFWRSLLAIVLAGVAILIFDWINAALGGDLGRPASMISRSSFGIIASRLLVSSVLVFICLGWYGIQVEITSRLTLFAFEVNPSNADYQILYLLTTAILGLVFALPAVIGTRLFPWINYLAIPIILFVCLGGVLLTLTRFGNPMDAFSALFCHPDSGAPLSLGVTSLIGVAAAQFLMLSDYSRYIRRLWPDSLFIPLIGIVPAGLLLFLTGLILSLNANNWDIVQILVLNLRLPLWAIAALIFAQGTTVLVGAYSAGLALANMFNVTHATSRSWITALAVFIGIGLAMLDLLSQLEIFLYIIALVCPVLGIILAIDHFVLRNRLWSPQTGVNWVAVFATIGGCLLGAIMPAGYPTFIAIFSAIFLYYGGMLAMSHIHNGPFIPEHWKRGKSRLIKGYPFLYCSLAGTGLAAGVPIFLQTPWAEISIICGCLLTGLGFFLQIRRGRGLAVEIE